MQKKKKKFFILVSLLLPVLTSGIPLANQCNLNEIWYNENGASLCCVPIKDPHYCGTNLFVKRCERNGDSDHCVPCEDGKFKFGNTTSDSEVQDMCYPEKWSCPEESVQPIVPTKYGECQCDESQGYVGADASSCTKVERKCEQNTFLKDGHCVACPDGTYRHGLGYGPCQKITTLLSVFQTTSIESDESSKKLVTTASQPTTIETPTEKNVTNMDIEEEVKSFGASIWMTVNYAWPITLIRTMHCPYDFDEKKQPFTLTRSTENKTLIYIVAVLSTVVFICAVVLLTVLGRKWLKRRRSNSLPAGQQNQPSQPLVTPDSTPESPRSSENPSQDCPPPYRESPPPYPKIPGEGRVEDEWQRAVPYMDNSVSQPVSHSVGHLVSHPGSSVTVNFPTLESGDSASSSQSNSHSVHVSADETRRKEVCRQSQEGLQDQSTSPLMGMKGESSVIPEKDESVDTPLLQSVPPLDPDSIRNDDS